MTKLKEVSTTFHSDIGITKMVVHTYISLGFFIMKNHLATKEHKEG